MKLEDLEKKDDLKHWILRDVYYMQLKDNQCDFLMKKETKRIVVTTNKKLLKQIWESSWPRREVVLGTMKALINKGTSEVVSLDGKNDSEGLFLTTEKNIHQDIKNQAFRYILEDKKPEAEFPE
jgi:hypothetical protein